MKLSFGNMTLEMNVFNICKQPRDDNDLQEVDFIEEHKIERALLDLGASVNLLLYSVFQSLNLGELKPTFVTLLLADRSVKVPREIGRASCRERVSPYV